MARIVRSKWRRAIRKNGGCCWFCGEPATTVDHAVPRSRGGGEWPKNLLPACFHCNNLKDNLTIEEFRKFLRMRLFRRFTCEGFWHRPEIVFYGERNSSPLFWH